MKPPPVVPLTEAELRPIITKSLGFLAKEGDEWIAARNCNGCHHLPGLLWSHREAKMRGFAVDQAKFEEWTSWAVEQMSGKRKPGLVEAALMTLAVPKKSSPMLTQVITKAQKADGAWDPGQVIATMQKRKPGEPDKGNNVTRLCLVALGVSPATKEAEVVPVEGFRSASEEGPVHHPGVRGPSLPFCPALRQAGGGECLAG